LNITFHAREVYSNSKHSSGGIARFNRQILESLCIFNPEIRFHAFVRPDFTWANKTVNLKTSTSYQKLLSNNILGANIETLLSDSSVFYSLSNEVASIKKGFKIGIIHDLLPITHPELMSKQSDSYFHKGSEASILFNNIVDYADLIHCNSYTTKLSVMEHLKVDSARLFVGYSYPNREFLLDNDENSPTASQPYLLTVSRIDSRKNLNRLCEAFSRLRCTDLQLYIVGKDGWGVDEVHAKVQSLGISERVHFLGHINDSELKKLYQKALWYICPSITEGYGIPNVEAMQLGCPVITSNGGALSEIVGDAGILFDPLDIDDMEEKIGFALSIEHERQNYITKGFNQVKKYSPELLSNSIITAIKDRI
jgi:glycosyltransferase involved in cell wall biosynthesis